MLRTRMRLELLLFFLRHHRGDGEWGVLLLWLPLVVPLLLRLVVVLVPRLVHTMLWVR